MRIFLFLIWVGWILSCASTGREEVILGNSSRFLAPKQLNRTPFEGFPIALPEDVGLDSAPLLRLSKSIREEGLEVRSLLIVKDGKLVMERYAGGTTRNHNHSVYSVTKTVTSTLLGILNFEGILKTVNEPVMNSLLSLGNLPFPLLEGKESLRLRDVLHMASGMRWSEFPEREDIRTAEDPLIIALLPEVKDKPGTKFDYSNGDSQLAAAVLENKAGMTLLHFAENTLFSWLDFKGYEWYTSPSGRQTAGFGLRLRPIDMVKFGILYLNNGSYQRKKILKLDWIKQAIKPGASQNYGYQLWTHQFEGKKTFMANGKGSQFVYVIPHRRMVIVTTAAIWDKPIHFLLDKILASVKESLNSKQKKKNPEKEAEFLKEIHEASLTVGNPALWKDLDEPHLVHHKR
ncbi:beta-lactamase [Leptospira weilii str. 2006001853]|uniref:Beta-lactamase n=3 Tax=Leptospira weilii TaxID=28184 RepID=A0A828Z5K4_9LEPT|nr:serine hydrolase [Leptospira weilii]EMM72232.1 beta-lactamase [Leptospira weilii str. 2006001855]EKR65673.1 beta-lactamase [Leptospira weilii str. 2006001853]EMN46191.1 beta-lactamase [Leptospira weilii str. LNT 1234]EMN90114.1 beta-lactamase [Leptospira weilii str. UI 13098]OMI18679.1 penicillin-binding protein [Leptospira weilii serovar Heyan]